MRCKCDSVKVFLKAFKMQVVKWEELYNTLRYFSLPNQQQVKRHCCLWLRYLQDIFAYCFNALRKVFQEMSWEIKIIFLFNYCAYNFKQLVNVIYSRYVSLWSVNCSRKCATLENVLKPMYKISLWTLFNNGTAFWKCKRF